MTRNAIKPELCSLKIEFERLRNGELNYAFLINDPVVGRDCLQSLRSEHPTIDNSSPHLDVYELVFHSFIKSFDFYLGYEWGGKTNLPQCKEGNAGEYGLILLGPEKARSNKLLTRTVRGC